MALNLSKTKIDKLIALLDSSGESTDLDDELDDIDEKPLIDDEEVIVKGEKDSELKDEPEDETDDKLKEYKYDIKDEKLSNEEIVVVKLEHKPIELVDSSFSEDEASATEDDPNDPLNIKMEDKELNLDLFYPKIEKKELEPKTDVDLLPIVDNVTKKKYVFKEEKKSPIPFKKKKSRIPLEKRVRCTICKAQRKNEEYLDLHMQTHDGKSEFECHVCGKFFSTTASVVRHQSLHEAAYKHQCEKCGKRFIFSSSLYSHKARHDDSRPFSCTVCGQTFKATKHLKRHMFIHTGERPFVCTVCGKAYSMKYMLKSHFKVHTRERHICKLCEKSFKRQNDFERHMEWHLTGLANKRISQKPRKPRKKRISEIPATNTAGDILNLNNIETTPVIEPLAPLVPPIPFQIPLFSRFNSS